MRFLWSSNAPWAGTGYGVQTRLMLPALQQMGHDPICFAFWGLQGGSIEYEGYPVVPGSPYDGWGSDVIQAHVNELHVDGVVTLMDPWVLTPKNWEDLGVPWIAWIPIDHDEIGWPMKEILKCVDVPVAMSWHGAHQLDDFGVAPAATIYHAVDTDVFTLASPESREAAREMLSIDQDAWVIGMVMANKGDRKQYPSHLRAIRLFMDEHPDLNVQVFIHTDLTDKMQGWDLREVVAKTGMKGHIRTTNQYRNVIIPLRPDEMVQVYHGMDVLMNCSTGEGFGVPIVEAQACGVPVITGGYTAMPEITINGYTVQAANKGLATHYGWQYWPDVEEMAYRLECVYRRNRHPFAEDGRRWVVDNCSIPVIAQQWSDLLTGVHAERVEGVLPPEREVIPE